MQFWPEGRLREGHYLTLTGMQFWPEGRLREGHYLTLTLTLTLGVRRIEKHFGETCRKMKSVGLPRETCAPNPTTTPQLKL